ncbi:HD domain-containing protein [Candidatus Woesearchaeota archaeon]|nr:HD domain-containing protein [Candidatus Woesearchaeota archaeon]
MKDIVNFFFETGMLKHAKRSGWWLINVKDPENIAEHSFRTAVIGYFLAKLENVDADKVVKMCLFHDLHESRVNDLHKVGQRYIDFKKGERKASKDQMRNLGKPGKEIYSLNEEFQKKESKEANVAKDADYVECAVQAKEYIEIGHKDAQNWIDNCKKCIKTESGKKLLSLIDKTSSNNWWRNLKKIER